MVKVLCVITTGLLRNGIVTSQLEYLRHMDLTNLQIDMLSVKPPRDGVVEDFKNLGCRVIQFPHRIKKILQYRASLKKLIREEKYDVVHVHGSSAILNIELGIAKKLKVPMRIAHSRNTTCSYKMLDKLLRSKFYKSYNVALACGKEAGEWLFPDRPFSVLHNGKDLKKFAFKSNVRYQIREKMHLGDKTVIGFVGNLDYQKNVEFLISVFNDYHTLNKNSCLVMMGEGSHREQIEQLTKDYGIENDVILTGRITNVHEMLQAMDIMLLPSRYEGLPNVVLEWQISGLPSLVSNAVTEECKTTDLVQFLPIDQGTTPWCNAIDSIDLDVDRKAASDYAVQRMKEEKFDIEEAAKFLQELYLSEVSNVKS